MAKETYNLRYAVLRHEGIPEPHYDLLFETAPGSPLAAWRSPTWPPEPQTSLTPLPDHRPAYLTYEGPVSNNRGSVQRIAAGHHRLLQNEPISLTLQLETGPTLRLPRAE